MSSSAQSMQLPDAVVSAVRRVSKPFLRLQSSRYAHASAAVNANTQAEEALSRSLIMRTKTALPPSGDDTEMEARHITPSRWSELCRTALEGEQEQQVADRRAQQLWGLVSTVLHVLEHGGMAGSGVNMSAAIVAWNERFNAPLDGVQDTVARLHVADPRRQSADEVEDLGSDVLGRIEGAFLSGHFEAAAVLMEAFLLFLRRGGSQLLSAEVETALADVKRLLATPFHDADTHALDWVEAANEQLQESRNALTNPSGSSNNSGRSVIDALVEDLCATCLDVLILITQDARQMVKRCRESNRTAVDFLVAACAIMEPYADLQRVAGIFEEYMEEWYDDTREQWFYESVYAILSVTSVSDVVEAMQRIAQTASTAFAWVGESGGGNNSGNDDGDDSDDAASDTVNLSDLATAATPVSFPHARRFILACMAAHVADVCAPAVVGSSAADMRLTFARNDLVTGYAELFAFDTRTWRTAGLYACYSPLVNPRFLADIVESVAPLAAVDAHTYDSVSAFLSTSWNPRSPHQQAVRAKMDAVLPGNATVAKWWAAVDHCRAEAHRRLHLEIISVQLDSGNWVRAAWLAIETQLTAALQSQLRHLLQSAAALQSEQLYAIGSAVHHAFIAIDTCTTAELSRYLCAAAALAAYRQAATAADAAFAALPSPPPTGAYGGAAVSPQRVTIALGAATECLQAIEAVLKSTDECDVMLHPSTTFALVEHGTSLLMSLRQLMREPGTGESTNSAHIPSCVLPLLVEAYQLSSVHFARADPLLETRSKALAEKLASVHQTCI